MELKEIIKDAVVVSDATTFGEALEAMLTQHTNTLLVADEDGKLAGAVSVSDLFDAVIPPNTDGDKALAQFADEAHFKAAVHAATETPISEFMSPDIDSVTPDDSFLQVAAIAIAQGSARIAVVDHSHRPVGIISRQGLKQILGKFL